MNGIILQQRPSKGKTREQAIKDLASDRGQTNWSIRMLMGFGVDHDFRPQPWEQPGRYGANPKWNGKKLSGKKRRKQQDHETEFSFI